MFLLALGSVLKIKFGPRMSTLIKREMGLDGAAESGIHSYIPRREFPTISCAESYNIGLGLGGGGVPLTSP